MKKRIFSVTLLIVLVFSFAFPVCAATHRYSRDIVMEYNIYAVSGNAAGAYTNSRSGQERAFVALFTYKGKDCVNSATNEQDCYVKLVVTYKGGDNAMSVHSLKYSNGAPVGVTKRLYR